MLSWLLGALRAGGFVVAGLLVRGQPGDVQLTGLASAPALLYGGIFAGICLWLVNRFSGVAPDDLLRATGPAVAGGMLAVVVATGAHRLLGGLVGSEWGTLATAGVPATLAAVVLLFAMDPRLRNLDPRLRNFARKTSRAVAAGVVAVSSRRHERPGGP